MPKEEAELKGIACFASQGTSLLCVGQSQGVVSSERAHYEQRDPLRSSAPRIDLRALKLVIAAQSVSHRAPFKFPGARRPRLPLAYTRNRGLEETQDMNRDLGVFRIVRLP